MHRLSKPFIDFLNSVPDLVWIKDLSYRYVFANNAFIDAVGVSLQKLRGLTDSELHALQNFSMSGRGGTRSEVFKIQDRKVIRGGVDLKAEDEIFDKIGNIKVFKKLKTPWRAESGEILGLIGISTDITQQKLAEREKQSKFERIELETLETKSLWEAAGRLARMGYSVWDHQSDEYVAVNETYAGLHGYSVEEFMTSFRTWEADSLLIHPDDRQRLNHFYETADFTRRHTFEYRIINRFGEVVYVRSVEVPLDLVGGKPAQTLHILIDITVAKLEEERYRLAARQARAALKAKTAILRNVTHELRTPLNGMLGMLFLVMPKVSDPEIAERLNFARLSAEKLSGLIDDILTVSESETRPARAKKTDIHLSREVQEVVDSMRDMALAKGMDIKVHTDVESEQVLFGDPERTRTALIKLVDNAIKFSSDGEIKVQVEQLKQDDSEAVFQISVADMGIGLSADHTEKIFEPFEQIETDNTRSYEGSGLGLSVAKYHVERMGGTIGVDSELGEGSKFWINLPLDRARPVSQFQLGGAFERAPRLIRQKTRGLRVLLIGDNQLGLERLSHLLERRGYESDLVSHTASVIDAVHSQQFDVVLLDLNPLGMDEFDVVAQLRQMGEKSATSFDVPILAMIETENADLLKQIRDAGINGLLRKPITEEHLFNSVSMWVDDPRKAALEELADQELFDQSKAGQGKGSGLSAEEFDPSAAYSGVRNDENAFRQFIKMYADFLDDELENLQHAFNADDPEDIGKVANSIAGSSKALGLVGISDLADQIGHLVWNLDGVNVDAELNSLLSKLGQQALRLRETLRTAESPVR